MKLQIFKEFQTRVPRQRLLKTFERVADGEGAKASPGQVNLILSSDARLKRLNREFRSINRSTDVLSFGFDEPLNAESVMGEIYISVERAEAQARQYGVSTGTELVRLFCHGFLHLLGYDHQQDQDARKMRQREERYLAIDYGGRS